MENLLSKFIIDVDKLKGNKEGAKAIICAIGVAAIYYLCSKSIDSVDN